MILEDKIRLLQDKVLELRDEISDINRILNSEEVCIQLYSISDRHFNIPSENVDFGSLKKRRKELNEQLDKLLEKEENIVEALDEEAPALIEDSGRVA